jgi:hypothetical protein
VRSFRLVQTARTDIFGLEMQVERAVQRQSGIRPDRS